MKKRERKKYWVAVCYAGINDNTGMVGASDWMHMGWGMGVCPEAGGAGCKGAMRKRVRDKGRGELDTDKEKAGGRAGVRAPRGNRRKPKPGNTELEEEPVGEERNNFLNRNEIRKGDGEMN